MRLLFSEFDRLRSPADLAGLPARGPARLLCRFGGGKSSQSSSTSSTTNNTQTGASDYGVVAGGSVDQSTAFDLSNNSTNFADNSTSLQANDNSQTSTNIQANDSSQNWSDSSTTINANDNSVHNDMSAAAIAQGFGAVAKLGELNRDSLTLGYDAAKFLTQGSNNVATKLGMGAMDLSRAVIGDNNELTSQGLSLVKQIAGQNAQTADNAFSGVKALAASQAAANSNRGLDQKTILIIAGIAAAALYALKGK